MNKPKNIKKYISFTNLNIHRLRIALCNNNVLNQYFFNFFFLRILTLKINLYLFVVCHENYLFIFFIKY